MKRLENNLGKLIEVLLTLLIFSLPLGAVFRVSVIQNAYLYPFDIIAGIILILSIPLLFGKKVQNTKIAVLNLLFAAIGGLSLVISSHFLNVDSYLISAAYLVRYLAYSSIMLTLSLLSHEFVAKIPAKLIMSGMLFILLGFVQFLYYPNLRNLYYLGWDDHLGRLFSTFLDPNYAGSFIALIFLLSAGIMFETYKKLGKLDVFLGVASVLSLIALFLSYSRSAFLLVFAGGIAFLSVQKLYKHLLVFAFLLIGGLFIFSNSKIEGSNIFRTASGFARVEASKDALSIISHNPLIGVGFNSYRYALVRYGLRDETPQISNADAGADNSYLFVLATCGIIGFLFFLDLWLNILKRVYISPVIFGSVVGLLVNTLFINSIFYSPIMAWIFLLIGVTLSKKR